MTINTDGGQEYCRICGEHHVVFPEAENHTASRMQKMQIYVEKIQEIINGAPLTIHERKEIDSIMAIFKEIFNIPKEKIYCNALLPCRPNKFSGNAMVNIIAFSRTRQGLENFLSLTKGWESKQNQREIATPVVKQA
ncbi:MAG: hypothetical protein COU81_01655 [Candidatus Portnoybacteria bacterium CG10_big_fil_rev_8_21_14_0_10_36_7]|uniref:Uncharacterized protein n=1 Tax=Candidatus Portnoybacteria bacterium CG10_big_fil_rev_8_21_14_0_10_36_7 TaxID=1974812 RepID=A0A2M8KEC3_9BACT|nr:MAG: hypothetical protein COU81_01655 [Candidatus Portnoybacteria bacterium CG10_big_fil_rev_8_21_14_0_10_36_7]